MNTEQPVRLCVTTTMHDIRTCTIKGEHTIRCDGLEYAWNPERDREETTGRKCNGCAPREARVGFLCVADWDKAETALIDWAHLEPGILAAGERAVQRDNGGIAGQQVGYVPLPGTMLAVEEIRSYLRTYTGTLERWAASREGAADAVRFARAVASAKRTHAIEEQSVRLQRLRCPHCKNLTMDRNPPLIPHSDITVTCDQCGKVIREHETTPDGIEKLVVIASIERSLENATKAPAAKIRTGGRDEFAEVYDPTQPAHADLDPLSLLPVPELRAMLPDDTPRLRSMRRAELIAAIHDREAA